MALLKGSQHAEEILEPNTMTTAKQMKLLIRSQRHLSSQDEFLKT